jgi:hypothetical protein
MPVEEESAVDDELAGPNDNSVPTGMDFSDLEEEVDDGDGEGDGAVVEGTPD